MEWVRLFLLTSSQKLPCTFNFYYPASGHSEVRKKTESKFQDFLRGKLSDTASVPITVSILLDAFMASRVLVATWTVRCVEYPGPSSDTLATSVMITAM